MSLSTKLPHSLRHWFALTEFHCVPTKNKNKNKNHIIWNQNNCLKKSVHKYILTNWLTGRLPFSQGKHIRFISFNWRQAYPGIRTSRSQWLVGKREIEWSSSIGSMKGSCQRDVRTFMLCDLERMWWRKFRRSISLLQGKPIEIG